MRLAPPLLAVLFALALAGCSAETDGSGSPDGADGGGSSASQPTASDTGSGSGSDDGTDDGDDGTDDGGADEGLDCTGDDVVAPAGQPFCFELPDGFSQEEIEVDNTAGGAASYTTGAALNESDVIVFSVYPLNIDSDDLSDTEITDALAPIITQLGEQGFAFESLEPDITTVDDARAFNYRGADAEGLASETYFIFRGATELQVNCQWSAEQAALLQGCDEVLDSLEITG